jgi:hypothetical protein
MHWFILHSKIPTHDKHAFSVRSVAASAAQTPVDSWTLERNGSKATVASSDGAGAAALAASKTKQRHPDTPENWSDSNILLVTI